VPTAWKGHWYGRAGESLVPLSTDELDRIRGESLPDWSSYLIEDSNVGHLDEEAIQIARKNYKAKQTRKHIGVEVDRMTDEEFLEKLNLIKDGKLTHAALVLLGKPEHENLMKSIARVMWRLYGSHELARDYFEFDIPFITVADRVYEKIRNLVYRYMPDRKTLFTTETMQYDEELLKELINNCVAHMDYAIGGRIYVDEFEDTIVISNPGSFIPGDVRKVLQKGYRAPYYRNPLLSTAMREVDMIDTIQLGIPKVYNIQRSRYFPMPDYDIASTNEVSVTVYGKTLDINYTRLLVDVGDLSIDTVFLLDRVQKKLPLEKNEYKFLRELGYIEGKIPNVYVSLMIANAIDKKEQYTKNKALDDKYYMDLVVKYLEQWGKGSRSDFIKLLTDKLPDVLSEKQKVNKVRNLLSTMGRNEVIKFVNGNQRTGVWILTKSV
jgi:ATP-dependent DNA helicase RecG